MAAFLTDEDVHHLTGYRQPVRQRRWLESKGIPFRVAPSGYPRVELSALGIPERAPAPEPCEPLPPMPDLPALAELRAARQRWTPGCGPSGSGIYFLFIRWAVVYIGQSKFVSARLRAHRLNWVFRKPEGKPFNRWSAIEVPEIHLTAAENHYIDLHQPAFNKRGIRGVR